MMAANQALYEVLSAGDRMVSYQSLGWIRIEYVLTGSTYSPFRGHDSGTLGVLSL